MYLGFILLFFAGEHYDLKVGAASKGIIQRDYQHNATVYKSPYAKVTKINLLGVWGEGGLSRNLTYLYSARRIHMTEKVIINRSTFSTQQIFIDCLLLFSSFSRGLRFSIFIYTVHENNYYVDIKIMSTYQQRKKKG